MLRFFVPALKQISTQTAMVVASAGTAVLLQDFFDCVYDRAMKKSPNEPATSSGKLDDLTNHRPIQPSR